MFKWLTVALEVAVFCYLLFMISFLLRIHS
jgi:hypothetical protein